MTPLEAHRVVATVVCRLAPDLADVLDTYLTVAAGRPYIDGDKIAAFRQHLITTIAARDDVTPQELWDLGVSLNTLRASGDDALVWSKIAAVLLPFSAVAALAQERR